MVDDGIESGSTDDGLAVSAVSAVSVAEPVQTASGPMQVPVAADALGFDDVGARLPIEALGQVELKVEVVLGRARLRLQELLDVRPGQSVELDRARNSPVDVLVNGTLFARGDIVVIDDTNLGVRVSEVIGNDFTKETR